MGILNPTLNHNSMVPPPPDNDFTNSFHDIPSPTYQLFFNNIIPSSLLNSNSKTAIHSSAVGIVLWEYNIIKLCKNQGSVSAANSSKYPTANVYINAGVAVARVSFCATWSQIKQILSSFVAGSAIKHIRYSNVLNVQAQVQSNNLPQVMSMVVCVASMPTLLVATFAQVCSVFLLSWIVRIAYWNVKNAAIVSNIECVGCAVNAIICRLIKRPTRRNVTMKNANCIVKK